MEAWTGRVEETGARCVVIFAHAATVIALGRAVGLSSISRRYLTDAAQLTGDKSLEVLAGCASSSLYRRKCLPQAPGLDATLTASRSTSSLAAASSLLALASSGNDESCGVGEWEAVWLGRADYLEKGLERDWSFRDVELRDGEVVNVRSSFSCTIVLGIADGASLTVQDDGDLGPHPVEDEIPTGLAKGMERYLRRGMPPKNPPTAETAGVKGRM